MSDHPGGFVPGEGALLDNILNEDAGHGSEGALLASHCDAGYVV